MEFVQRGGRGQTPNPDFGSIEKHSWYSLLFLICIFKSKLYGGGGLTKSLDKFHTCIYFFLNEDLPYAEDILRTLLHFSNTESLEWFLLHQNF